MTNPKTAIVTGASSGIGLGVTTALMKHVIESLPIQDISHRQRP